MSLDGAITNLASWAGNTMMPTIAGLLFAGAVYRYSKGSPFEQFLYGGFASLMLQSLHPLAMAGVVQHSDFRTDPVGRLNRTVAYVLATTYGSTEAAEKVIARVRRIHPLVHGVADDGRPYRADDPELLTWVHIAEVRCFLAGYEAFGAPPLTAAERDQYYWETARLARRLGADDVPETAAEVAAYLKRLRPELRAGYRSDSSPSVMPIRSWCGRPPGRRSLASPC